MEKEEKLQWYLEHKRWGYVLPVIFKREQFDKASNELKDQFETYQYIFARLNENQRLEFKNDYLDRVNELAEIQKHRKFKELFHRQYLKIEQYNPEGKTNEPKEMPVEFKDFFNPKNISDKQIEVIQSKFKNSKGKKMAMLIYELSKRDLIEIIENSKMQGRKHFIQSLNKNIKRETGINYYLRQGANGLELNNTDEKDDYYKNVSNEISEILK